MRGLPVDRYYIERFLASHADDIKGRVLEVADPSYTRKFGGARVLQSDVLHAVEGNEHATICGDLASGRGLPDAAFDCVILTQVYQFIYDIKAAVETTRRILKPGGVVLATFPLLSQISRYDMDRWGDYWRISDRCAEMLFGDVFGAGNVSVTTYGNVLSACAFLHELASDELTTAEKDAHDPDIQLIVAVRAVNA